MPRRCVGRSPPPRRSGRLAATGRGLHWRRTQQPGPWSEAAAPPAPAGPQSRTAPEQRLLPPQARLPPFATQTPLPLLAAGRRLQPQTSPRAFPRREPRATGPARTSPGGSKASTTAAHACPVFARERSTRDTPGPIRLGAASGGHCLWEHPHCSTPTLRRALRQSHKCPPLYSALLPALACHLLVQHQPRSAGGRRSYRAERSGAPPRGPSRTPKRTTFGGEAAA
mmetsp:Transcript_20293/g.38836  ORF Transcript_20293/g.38836 Transcript_20293/m.38836 type:complete len:226 (+) Transcript_20293:137-814(+)